eukprot:gnl/MRDRNA2_/MRDRNA2_56560_c0_seq1.p1 gnl/MRDRNA2_/MRDRNA2_56560_c0~~gnl/MRDRNA2_/MRDRNA2_56560_c0_seq1.p1  ORF type:complete len:238 (-),score=37.28 gnl/MRDRNA2_/MRDRNA2_56560_c0_seq1:50-763(-)
MGERTPSKVTARDAGDKDGTWKVSPYSLFQRRLVTETIGNMTVRSSVTMAPNVDSVSEYKLNMEQSKVACNAGGDEVIYVKSDALQPELPALCSNDPSVRRSSVMRLQEVQLEKPLHEEVAANGEATPGDANPPEAPEVQMSRNPRNPKLKPVETPRNPLSRSADGPRIKTGGFREAGTNFSNTWSPRGLSPKSPHSPWSPRSGKRKTNINGIRLRPVWDINALKDIQYNVSQVSKK